MFPVDPEFNLMEEVGGYRLINRCKVAEIVEERIL